MRVSPGFKAGSCSRETERDSAGLGPAREIWADSGRFPPGHQGVQAGLPAPAAPMTLGPPILTSSPGATIVPG